MKLEKKVKKYIQAIRPLVDVKYKKSLKEKKALKDLLARLKKRYKSNQVKLSNKKLSKSKRKDLEQELQIIEKQRIKGFKLLKKVKNS